MFNRVDANTKNSIVKKIHSTHPYYLLPPLSMRWSLCYCYYSKYRSVPSGFRCPLCLDVLLCLHTVKRFCQLTTKLFIKQQFLTLSMQIIRMRKILTACKYTSHRGEHLTWNCLYFVKFQKYIEK